MKHAKHSGDNNKNKSNEEILLCNDIYSSSSRRRKPISAKELKRRKILNAIAKILLPIGLLTAVALVIYISVVQLMPLTYILAVILVLGILVAVHLRLFSGSKRHIKRKRIISIALSVVTVIVSCFGMSYVGIFNGAIGDIAIGDGDNDDKVDNISKHPFVVYLSGIDTRNYGEIADKSRSDVNMIIAVNPRQKRILMVSTPRDYYVALEGDPNKMDKLTHAGSYGIECSMSTLEALYDIEFNYYAKVNFMSVVDLVDALGGVTVNSEYNFSSKHTLTGEVYTYKKGENFLNGQQALTFARERESFANGDRQRGIHQQELIKQVVKKAISPSILIPSNIENIMDAISKNTKTNFTEKEIKKLITYQMSTMGKEWDFESMSADGTGDMAYTYSYSAQKLYVMRPNMETVNAAKEALDAIMNGEEISKDTESNVSSK